MIGLIYSLKVKYSEPRVTICVSTPWRDCPASDWPFNPNASKLYPEWRQLNFNREPIKENTAMEITLGMVDDLQEMNDRYQERAGTSLKADMQDALREWTAKYVKPPRIIATDEMNQKFIRFGTTSISSRGMLADLQDFLDDITGHKPPELPTNVFRLTVTYDNRNSSAANWDKRIIPLLKVAGFVNWTPACTQATQYAMEKISDCLDNPDFAPAFYAKCDRAGLFTQPSAYAIDCLREARAFAKWLLDKVSGNPKHTLAFQNI
jgi:hypothetical protein